MDRVKILALGPGKELNDLITRELMGYENDWSGSISAAWEVVEKMRENYALELRAGREKQSAGFTKYGSIIHDAIPDYYAQCDNASESICKAAILAILEV